MIYVIQAKEKDEGTQCQQALIILSDGSASYEEDIFNEYNADKSVSIGALSFVVLLFCVCYLNQEREGQVVTGGGSYMLVT